MVQNQHRTPGRPTFKDLLFLPGHITVSRQVRAISYKLLHSATQVSRLLRLVMSETEATVKAFFRQLKIPETNGWAW